MILSLAAMMWGVGVKQDLEQSLVRPLNFVGWRPHDALEVLKSLLSALVQGLWVSGARGGAG